MGLKTTSPFLTQVDMLRKVYGILGVVPWAWLLDNPWLVLLQVFGIIGLIRTQLRLNAYSKDLDTIEPVVKALQDAQGNVFPPSAARVKAEKAFDEWVAWFNGKYGPEFTASSFNDIRDKYDRKE